MAGPALCGLVHLRMPETLRISLTLATSLSPIPSRTMMPAERRPTPREHPRAPGHYFAVGPEGSGLAPRRLVEPAGPDAVMCRAILESATDHAILTLDAAGRVTSWNPGARNLLGWSEAEALGMDGRLIFTPEDCERLAPETEMALALAEGRAEDERWHQRKDGSRFWGSGLMVPLRGTPAPGFLKIMRDRTDQRRAERDLQAAHLQISEILESVTDAFYAVDRDFRLTYANRRALELWGKHPDEALGRTLLEVLPAAADSASYAAQLVVARERQPAHLEAFSPVLGRWIGVSIYPAEGGGLSVYFRDISERKEAEERQALLVQELAHRVKNTLAVIQSMARQTGGRASTVPEFLGAFEGRLHALASAHELLTESGWHRTSLASLAKAALAAHDEPAGGRVRMDLTAVRLKPAAAQNLVLALHELATNAAKYGALSTPAGTVTLEGYIEGDALMLAWRETGGPATTPPEELGFGTMLLDRVVTHQHGGKVDLDWRPEGLACTLRLPLDEIAD
jgi:PAS domain S-box-containing protein